MNLGTSLDDLLDGLLEELSAPENPTLSRAPSEVLRSDPCRHPKAAGVERTVDDVAQLFRLFDRNGDGKIDRHEFTRVIQSLEAGFTQRELDDLMRTADANGDDDIQYVEFCSWIFSIPEKNNGLWSRFQTLRYKTISVSIVDARANHADLHPRVDLFLDECVSVLRSRVQQVLQVDGDI